MLNLHFWNESCVVVSKNFFLIIQNAEMQREKRRSGKKPPPTDLFPKCLQQ